MSVRVGYCSAFVPPEWIAAYGLQGLRLIPDGSAPAGEGICPFAMAFARSAGACDLDAVIVTSTCDQMRRIAEQIDLPLDRVFLMNVPATWQTSTSRDLYLQELRRLGSFLQRLGGQKPEGWQLAEVMRRYEHGRWALRRPHDGGETGGVRLALVGGPMRQRDFRIFDIIKQTGAEVVLDATEFGQRGMPGAFNQTALEQDPLAELARAYFDAIPDAFRRPDTLLHEYLRREFSGRRVQGIILVRYLWCDLWHAQLPRLKHDTSLPVVELDLTGQESDLQRMRSRIESLVEILR